MASLTALDDLLKALRCLPHVGPKSAQRIAFKLLSQDREAAHLLAKSLSAALEDIQHCDWCRNFSVHPICDLCANEQRNRGLLCVVESPMDVLAIEQTHRFDGLYFVLMGVLSPMDAAGFAEAGLEALKKRVQKEPIEEVILANNFTNEGETTAYVIAKMLSNMDIRVTRLAHGVPVGGELEYLDVGTVAKAFLSRQNY